MIDIAITLYVISLLNSLDGLSELILILTACLVVALPLIAMFVNDFCPDYRDKFKKLLAKYIKIYLFAIFIPAGVFVITIPSERTMYMIAGLYASDKVINTVADSEIAKQAGRTLLAKLQELEKECLTTEKTDDTAN